MNNKSWLVNVQQKLVGQSATKASWIKYNKSSLINAQQTLVAQCTTKAACSKLAISKMKMPMT